MMRKARQLVGLDIGSSGIKAVELKEVAGGPTVVAFGSEPTPTGAVVDGTIEDPVAVANALRRLFDRQPARTRNVAAAVSGGGVFVKRISVPVMTDVELAASIEWEVEQHIPLELEEVHFDYQPVEDRSVAGPTEVLLVAARRDKVAQHAQAISMGGLHPAIVDVAALALQNVYEANHEIDPNAVVALVDAGASAITVHVVRGGRMLFTRGFAATGDVMLDTAAGLDVVARAVATRMDRIVLTGGASRARGLADALSARFAVPVEPLDPFRRIVFEPSLFAVDAAAAATHAIAVGLGLRRRKDR